MTQRPRMDCTYDYVDEFGNFLYQVIRYVPKDFRPRHRDEGGRWKWGLEGVRRVPYGADRLARLKGEAIFLCEGEKDTETAWGLGLNASCCSGGSSGWKREFAEHFRDNFVFILPHNDDAGRKYAATARDSLAGVTADVTTVILPGLVEKGDLTDFVAAGGTRDDVLRLATEAVVAKKNAAVNEDADDVPSIDPPRSPATNGKPRLWTVQRERFSDIKPEHLTWLWENVWLDCSINLLTGAPGLGKTFVAAHLAACVSRGLGWPDGSGRAPLGDVVFMSAEDSYASVLVHRVAAAGGDLDRVHRWTKKVQQLDDGSTDATEITLEDLDYVAADIDELPDLKLVIFDPVTSYLGSADANDNAEVRRVLGRLVELAETKRFTVLLITHDKKMNVAAINSPMGSTAFTALPRVVQGLYRDEEDETKKRRVLAPIKNNHGDDRVSRTFSIDTPGGTAIKSRILWDEKLDMRSADQIRAQAAKALTSWGKEQTDDDTSKRRQVKVLMIVDAVINSKEGWCTLAEIREKSGMSNSTLNAAVFEMTQAGILEETTVDKDLPNGGKQAGGQRAVRRPRPS